MSNHKIFIIEDDINLLYNLESHFSVDEYQVSTSQGDEEIEELVNKIRGVLPDYIILDLILPKIDGFEIVKKIKEDEELSNIPIFIFTDLSDEDSKARSVELGAEYYFLKEEFDTFQFSERVKKIVDNQDSMSSEDII
jgi:DNA-binding response OmpR family regulator